MFIDILLLIAIVTAVLKGYSKGLIVALFSFVAIFIGLAAALKLSATVAQWLKTNTSIGTHWLPFISFAVVMIAVIFLVRMLANFIEKTVEFAMLGWINKLGGIALYTLLYVSVLSIVLFYMIQMNLLNKTQVSGSVTYPYFEHWGQKAIGFFNSAIPIFKNVFQQLQDFFQTKAQSIV